MSENQYTPGPWGHDADSGEIYFDDGDLIPVIAFVNREDVDGEQAIADGILIAAAPDLFDALRSLLSLVEAGRDPFNEPGRPTVKAARAALSRASQVQP